MYFIHYILINMLRPLLRPCIYSTFIIVTEIVVILKLLWSDGDNVNHICTFVFL